MAMRWEGDERGRGVASAAAEVEALDRLRAAMVEPDWVAEDPDAHLLPHVQHACAANGWKIRRAEVVDAVLEVDVEAGGQRRDLWQAAYTILGSFAETFTHVVETGSDDRSSVDLVVTTGMPTGDGPFAAHGHVVRLSVHGT